MSAAIELRDVHFAFPGGTFALDVGELCVEPGEAVACAGRSGAGKSTLVGLIAGLLTPERGLVRVLGQDLGALPEPQRRAFRRRRIGLVFQELELVEYLSAADNIRLLEFLDPALAREALGGRRAGALRAQELARATGLDAALLRRKPARLSQGERQRVALCRALFARPAVLLCDEPTGNLDPESASAALELLLAAGREHGAAIFFVTHDRELLARFDRTVRVGAEAPGAARVLQGSAR